MDINKTRNYRLGSDSVWLLSGLALAACGGGSGGVGFRRLMLTGDVGFTDNNAGHHTASIGETPDPVEFHSVKELWDLNLISFTGPPEAFGQGSGGAGSRFVRAEVMSDHSAEVTIRDSAGVLETYTVTLTGADAARFRFMQEGSDMRVATVGAFDFENPTNANAATAPNVYEFTETWSRTGRTETFEYRLTIEDIPETGQTNPTSATSPHEFSNLPDGNSIASVLESNTALMFESIREDFIDDEIQFRSIVSVEVMDAHTVRVHFDVQVLADLIYTIRLSGDDADDFEFVQVGAGMTDARLQTVAPLLFASPRDEDSNNIYEFTATRTLDAPGYHLVEPVNDYTLHILDDPLI
jgi:hypothetical protein